MSSYLPIPDELRSKMCAEMRIEEGLPPIDMYEQGYVRRVECSEHDQHMIRDDAGGAQLIKTTSETWQITLDPRTFKMAWTRLN